MSDERVATLLAVERVIRDSAAHNDVRDWDALAALYTPDARLTRPSGQTAVGRDAIRAAYAGGATDRRTRHLCTDVRVEVDGRGTEASASTTVLLVSWTRDPDAAAGDVPTASGSAVGEFADRLVLTDDGWRLAERIARLDVRLP